MIIVFLWLLVVLHDHFVIGSHAHFWVDVYALRTQLRDSIADFCSKACVYKKIEIPTSRCASAKLVPLGICHPTEVGEEAKHEEACALDNINLPRAILSR